MDEILAPQIPIVDPHHHLPSGWMQYELEEALADYLSGHTVRATVHVEAHSHYRGTGPLLLRPIGETEFLVAMAEEVERRGLPLALCAGIVGYVDLTQGAAVGEALDAHIAAARGRFRGVRADFYWDKPAEGPWHPSAIQSLCDHPGICAGIAELAPRGLSCDLVAFHPNLPDVARLAARFPDTTFVVDHLGAPMQSTGSADPGELFRAWRKDIELIASRPNVRMKLGGATNAYISRSLPAISALGERAPAHAGELAEAYRPYVEHAIDCFTPARCMFESNFPVDKAFTSFRSLWNAFKRLVQAYSSDEQHALLGATAADVYRV